ncbi:MAG: hypothetical protein CTY19_16490 [Methylomonas sp.]|nr:MAG: hypothetical protein CTY19_16490 [Methylomonas sp.]
MRKTFAILGFWVPAIPTGTTCPVLREIIFNQILRISLQIISPFEKGGIEGDLLKNLPPTHLYQREEQESCDSE